MGSNLIRSIALKLLSLLNKLGYYLVKRDDSDFNDQKNLIPNPKIIIDVGSNKGQTIKTYIDLFPSNLVSFFSFEPILTLIEEQKATFKNNKNITFINKAVSNYEGEVTFNINNNEDTSSILQVNSDFIPDRYGQVYLLNKQVSVPTTTLDIFINENSLSQIDILKIDVQGAEMQVLQGAINALKEKKNKINLYRMFICTTL